MKYQKMIGNTVSAEYGKETGNPYREALPEFMGKEEFFKKIGSSLPVLHGLEKRQPQERRGYISELARCFMPMDYMYAIYDILYRAMAGTYQTKTIVESVRQLNAIYTDFRTGRERELPYATQAFSGAILGVPGIGKTSTVQRCLAAMPQVIVHTKYQGKEFYAKQINYLTVECPSDCSVKTLAFNIFNAIDRAIGSDYFSQVARSRSLAASAITTKLKIICLNHHIGLIVIDEIQNAVLTAQKNRQIKPLIKFLVELTNETATAICFCGTLEAEEVFTSQEHLKRRTRGLRLLPMKYDVTYRKFIKELWEYQVTLQRAPLTEKLMKQIYDLSGGIPAYIVRIIQEAQAQAILSGTEKLSYGMVKQAVAVSGIEVPKVYGRGGMSISDFSVQEVALEEIGMEDDVGGAEPKVIHLDPIRERMEGPEELHPIAACSQSALDLVTACTESAFLPVTAGAAHQRPQEMANGVNQRPQEMANGVNQRPQEMANGVNQRPQEMANGVNQRPQEMAVRAHQQPQELMNEPHQRTQGEADGTHQQPQGNTKKASLNLLHGMGSAMDCGDAGPVKRFYASRRGRPEAERDESDLIMLWKKDGTPDGLMESLGDCQMLERRCL